MESPQVLSDQLPPDVLLTSDDPKAVTPPTMAQTDAAATERMSVGGGTQEVGGRNGEQPASKPNQGHTQRSGNSREQSNSPSVRE